MIASMSTKYEYKMRNMRENSIFHQSRQNAPISHENQSASIINNCNYIIINNCKNHTDYKYKIIKSKWKKW